MDYVRVCIFDAKQSEATGGTAEPTIGFWCEPCQQEAAGKAFNEAVAAILDAEPKPMPGEVLSPTGKPDIVEQALALVKKMTRAQRERFYGLLHKRYPSLFVAI